VFQRLDRHSACFIVADDQLMNVFTHKALFLWSSGEAAGAATSDGG
jgi:hypothetical protein